MNNKITLFLEVKMFSSSRYQKWFIYSEKFEDLYWLKDSQRKGKAGYVVKGIT